MVAGEADFPLALPRAETGTCRIISTIDGPSGAGRLHPQPCAQVCTSSC